ncbi:MAG: GntR family transcriptional regulator [Ilumatobacteraceae bacterium]
MTTGVPTLGGGQPPTLTEWADQQLREAILQGQFAPGDALVISSLAEQLGLSATPLREALRNLAADGLVVLQSHGSARVAEVDLHEANEIYELRMMLEPMALERAVANGGETYRAAVEAAWLALTAHRLAPPSDHAAFHRALLSACDSAWLLRLATMLADRAGLMITVGLPVRPASYDTAEVHRRLKELAVAGDAQGAAKELARHLGTTLTALHAVAAKT